MSVETNAAIVGLMPDVSATARPRPRRLLFQAAKRVFDIAVSATALLVLLGPLVLLALAIKISSRGPVFYCQPRVGRGGRRFWLYKFRTMVPGNRGPQVTAEDDPRVTPIGRLLRRWKLDELAQLWNVLRGDMSIIGPRPEVERFVRLYSAEERAVLDDKPGLAGMATLVFAGEAEWLRGSADPERVYAEELLPRKLAVDLQYERRRTFWSDLRLFVGVLLAVLGRNPYKLRSLTEAPARSSTAPRST